MGELNRRVFEWIWSFAHRNAALDAVGIFCAEYLPYLLVLGFFVLVFSEHGWRKRLFLFGEGALAVLISRGMLTEIIRFFYHHPRPFDALGFMPLVSETGTSFPSGHAAFFFALAAIVFFANRHWGIWYFLASAAISIARIYVGVHWPLDILGGALIGIAVGTLVHLSLREGARKIDKSTRVLEKG